ncbi:MAG: heparinase II/III family protein [Rhizobiales bacterium]|nr:heparinase II/III family protein [Hyphomicrobiales bacterium]
MQRVGSIDGTASGLVTSPLTRLVTSLAGPDIRRLELPFIPLRRGSPAIAREFYRGRFNLAGADVRLENAWELGRADGPPAWRREFHGLAWLAHLEAEGRELHRVFARALCAQLLAAKSLPVAAEDLILTRARRLISLITHGRMLTENAPVEFLEVFFGHMRREWRALQGRGKTGDEKLYAAIACAYAVSGLAGLGAYRDAAFARLEAELDQQILPDGGHISRNPARLVGLLLDLIPLRRALWTSHRVIPPRLNAAIERMTPMLRFFTHGDGGLAAFQGAAGPMTADVASILESDTAAGSPLTQAPHTGYCRLAHGPSLVLADCGAPVRCASPLAFEFSDGPYRIIVNCGEPLIANDAWSRATAETAAHSTLGLVEADGAGRSRRLRWRSSPGAGRAEAKLSVLSEGSILRGWQDAPAAATNVIHERDIYLGKAGADLRGEDRIRPLTGGPTQAGRFCIRFHLHPAVKATISKDGESVLLLMPNRNGWRFSARGAQPLLEESVYLFGQALPRQSQQIVLAGEIGRNDRINWAFRRIDKRNASSAETGETASLPF